MSSPGFEPSPNGTAVSVANHYSDGRQQTLSSTDLDALTLLLPPSKYGGYGPQLVTEWVRIPSKLSDRHPIHLQWVPSHVGLLGNKVADDLAKAATSNPVDPEDHMVLQSTEIYSRAKELICRTWVVPLVHPWYFQRHPGSAI
ncbi:RNase H domain-containing protein [Trichonephila clavipes]|nr:RNase H domain-containing protein [Trichonephila clavipes]